MKEPQIYDHTFLSGGGEMGRLTRHYDWANNPLGPPELWSQSLKSTLTIMLANRFPMILWWGDHFIQFYNDAYIPVPGLKHPGALGQPASQCWPEIWTIIGPLIEVPMNGGPATWDDDLLLEVNRKNFTEETHFIIAYSPIPDETAPNGIGGVLATVNEITLQVVGDRRMSLLRDLGVEALRAKTAGGACEIAAETMALYPMDIPFAYFYELNVARDNVKLIATTEAETNLAPLTIDLPSPNASKWNLLQALQSGKTVILNNLKDLLTRVPAGPWSDAPHSAAIIPVRGNRPNDWFGFLICGISSRLLYDVKYDRFLQMLGAQISSAVSTGSAVEEERKRLEALAEIDKAKTIFFNNISHEFRTPLTLMLGPTEELLERQTQSESPERRLLEVVHRNTYRLLKLVNTLLDFSRIEAGRIEATYEPVNLSAVTEDLASTFRSAIEKAHLQFIVDCPLDLPEVYVDKDMWEKIVLNLLSNAYKFTKSGYIAVRLVRRPNAVLLLVKDSGVGIPKEEIPKIFERFHRTQTSFARTYEGTGIGLSMVKELVNLHKGTIEVDSELNKGTTIIVSVPLGTDHLPKDNTIALSEGKKLDLKNVFAQEMLRWSGENNFEEQSKKNVNVKNTKRILFADDNADMREYVKRILIEDYEIDVVSTGREALKQITIATPDLLITDVMMPVMDGFELLKSIRSNPKVAAVPVIMLSARAGEEAVLEGIGNGADDYMVKPFSAKELTARIANLLKITEARQRAELEFRNLIMQSPVAIGLLQGEHLVISIANKALLDLFGREANVIGKPLLEVIPDIEMQGMAELLEKVLQSGKAYADHDVRMTLIRNGHSEEVYINFLFQPYRGSGGSVVGVTIIATDVTAQAIAKLTIEEKEKQFRNVLLQSPNIFVILKGPNMIIDFVNEPLLASWGRTWNILGKPLLEAMPELHNQAFPGLLEKVYKTGQVHYGKEEKAELVKDDKLVDVYYNYVYQPVLANNGSVTGIIIMATDITEQVLARKKIEESKEELHNLLRQAPAAMVILEGPDHTYTFANSLYEKLVGRTTEDLLGKTLIEVFPEVETQGTIALFDDVYESGLPYANHEYPLTWNKPGVGIVHSIFDFTVTPLRKGDAKVESLIVHAYEVTALVQANEKIAESEKKYRTLFDSIDEGFCTIEVLFNEDGKPVDYRFLEVNLAFTRQTGIENAEGKRMREIAPRHEEYWFETYGKIALTGEAMRFQNHAQQLGRYYDVYAFRIGEPAERKVALIFNDITSRKQIEIDRKRFSEKLEYLVDQRTKDLKETNIKLQKSNEDLEQFTFIASHDLQEPLRKIRTFSSMLLSVAQSADEKQKSLIERIDNSARRMSALIKDLLDFSRLKSEDRFVQVNLDTVVKNVLGDFDLLREQTNAVIEIVSLPIIEAIPLQMNQLFTNLIGNALKFSVATDQPRISVRCEEMSREEVSRYEKLRVGSKYYRISVEDNGIGFDQQFSEQIFHLFQRLHPKTLYGGSGIGLALCRKIVEENHHGIILANGVEGKGSTFHVILPAEVPK